MADIYTKEKRSEIMSRVRSRDTRPEGIVRSVIHRLGLRFRLAVGDLPGRPDVVLRRLKTVVFVNGCYWHGHDCSKGRSKAKTNVAFWAKKISDNVARDRRTFSRIKDQGWRILVVWECQTKNVEKLRSHLAEELIRV
jgi:DNA mismatch endonuclease (patch repair protein)